MKFQTRFVVLWYALDPVPIETGECHHLMGQSHGYAAPRENANSTEFHSLIVNQNFIVTFHMYMKKFRCSSIYARAIMSKNINSHEW